MTDARHLEQRILDTWDFADPTASAERFGRAADAADGEESVVLRTQQARATGLSGDFETARTLLDGLHPTSPHALARVAIEKGRVLNSPGNPADAAPLFEEAHRHATAAGLGGLAIDALHMQAIAAGAQHGPAAARVIDEQALERIEASDDPQVRRWLGSVLNNLGWDLFDSGSPEEALPVFDRAVEVRAASQDHGAWVVARWCVGRTLRALGRYEEALALQRSLAADPAGASDPYIQEEIAANEAALLS